MNVQLEAIRIVAQTMALAHESLESWENWKQEADAFLRKAVEEKGFPLTTGDGEPSDEFLEHITNWQHLCCDKKSSFPLSGMN